MSDYQAMYYEIKDKYLYCQLCPHHCRLKEGQTGLCRVRKNCGGVLIAVNYGEISSIAVDPIEKKPLFHYYPGSYILSVGTYGCNFDCLFCQNYSIAHNNPNVYYLDPQSLVAVAAKAQKKGSIGVAFTYNEPSIWYEYIIDAAPLLKEKGYKVVLVSNGFLEEKPLKTLRPFIDAVNIDVKAFSEDFYRKICRGSLRPVLRTVEELSGKVHIEVTTLLIPGKNDSCNEIQELCRWLSGIDINIPLHINRYYPSYNMQDIPPTPTATLYNAQEIACRYLNFVYIGNLGKENNTYCPDCSNILIERNSFKVDPGGIKSGKCNRCGRVIDFIAGSSK
jgi:pyruvate formate lyase activating enzyme